MANFLTIPTGTALPQTTLTTSHILEASRPDLRFGTPRFPSFVKQTNGKYIVVSKPVRQQDLNSLRSSLSTLHSDAERFLHAQGEFEHVEAAATKYDLPATKGAWRIDGFSNFDDYGHVKFTKQIDPDKTHFFFYEYNGGSLSKRHHSYQIGEEEALIRRTQKVDYDDKGNLQVSYKFELSLLYGAQLLASMGKIDPDQIQSVANNPLFLGRVWTEILALSGQYNITKDTKIELEGNIPFPDSTTARLAPKDFALRMVGEPEGSGLEVLYKKNPRTAQQTLIFKIQPTQNHTGNFALAESLIKYLWPDE